MSGDGKRSVAEWPKLPHPSSTLPKLPKLVGQSMSALPGNSDINLFRYGQGVIDLDAEVPDGAFDLGVAEQKLRGSQVTGTPVDQGCFGPSECMCAEEVRVQPMLAIHSETSRAYCRVDRHRPRPRRPTKRDSPGFLAATLM